MKIFIIEQCTSRTKCEKRKLDVPLLAATPFPLLATAPVAAEDEEEAEVEEEDSRGFFSPLSPILFFLCFARDPGITRPHFEFSQHPDRV